ncbi:hypothetical protein L7F22_035932 [Adiantum nelumboides]|nr:hypothetical protein [Adiantum nelumboides]
MFPASKRRWLRVDGSYEKEPQEAGEEDDDQFTTDKTRLLSVQSSSAFTGLDVNEAQKGGNIHHDHEGQSQSQVECSKLSDFAYRFDKGTHDTTSSEELEVGNPHQPNHNHKLNSACLALPIKKRCNHASWQGFKQILKKQFTPPFPFGKGLLPPEDSQHLRQRRFEGAMHRHRSSKILGASTNIIELRKLDAKIQNGINKSAFAASSKRGRSKENFPYHLDCNSGTSRNNIKLGSTEGFFANASSDADSAELSWNKRVPLVPKHCKKENGISER